eukprot:2093758-Rhodomonas_salina.1
MHKHARTHTYTHSLAYDATSLRACYTLPGTDLACMVLTGVESLASSLAMLLRLSDMLLRVSDTELLPDAAERVSAFLPPYAMSGTDLRRYARPKGARVSTESGETGRFLHPSMAARIPCMETLRHLWRQC